MRDKKLILLAVLGLLGIGSLIYGIVTPSRVKRGLSPANGSSSAEKAAAFPLERRAARSAHAVWGRSPFVFQTGETEAGLVLNGIAWDEVSPKAIINDQIVGVGDRIAGQTVVSIAPTGVTLSSGAQETVLKVRRKA